MRILLIGNFAPPYEDENIHNLLFLRRLQDEGHDCTVLNISEHASKEEDILDTGSYIDFILKVLRFSWKRDVIHFFTKGYTRLGLLKLMTAIFIGRIYRAKPITTLHSEFFSVIGQMRSPVGGEQTVYLSFSLAKKIIFQDKDTYDTASKFKRRQNFELVPLFLQKGSGDRDAQTYPLRKIQDRKKIIVFSGIVYPSFIFDLLNHYLTDHLRSHDVGVVISFAEKHYAKLQHVIEESVGEFAENLLFTGPDDLTLMTEAYITADIIVRPLSCDGKSFFQNFALYIRQPADSGGYRYFPRSMVLVKEGDMAATCAFIAVAILSGTADEVPGRDGEDFFAKVKNIYDE